MTTDPRSDKELYYDLIMQVERKFPGESRHDTAKRYIKWAEHHQTEGKAMCAEALVKVIEEDK